MPVFFYDAPVGTLTLTSDGAALTGLWMPAQKDAPPLCRDVPGPGAEAVFALAERCLTAYFQGQTLPPAPPLSPAGSDFSKAVWQLLRQIPYGRVTTYGALAQALRDRGIPASPRAVGGAVGRNPISLFIPCHRVVGAQGHLTGYAGGLEQKRFLLELEGADMAHPWTPGALRRPGRG